ncbi:UNVERIFIED_CONTAM: hypothetical protein NCL1_16799 [Trichonephila clavipes]
MMGALEIPPVDVPSLSYLLCGNDSGRWPIARGRGRKIKSNVKSNQNAVSCVKLMRRKANVYLIFFGSCMNNQQSKSIYKVPYILYFRFFY